MALLFNVAEKKQLIIKHENKKFQSRLWLSLVVGRFLTDNKMDIIEKSAGHSTNALIVEYLS